MVNRKLDGGGSSAACVEELACNLTTVLIAFTVDRFAPEWVIVAIRGLVYGIEVGVAVARRPCPPHLEIMPAALHVPIGRPECEGTRPGTRFLVGRRLNTMFSLGADLVSSGVCELVGSGAGGEVAVQGCPYQ